jgi:zinc finger BED domain-containing protein 1 (E3 SUMO-protein ligase ZBED1)
MKKEQSTTVSPADSIIQLIENELSLYVSEPPIEQTDDNAKGNVFAWWKDNAGHFPRMAKLAKVYLAVPATSVASERSFSKAGEIITSRRSSLKPLKAEQVIFSS